MNRAAASRSSEPPATRELILEAAERHFAERGFAGVSMRQIATDAGLRNQASLYHHFRDKRALYEAVLARGIGPIVHLVVDGNGRRLAAADVGPTLDALVDYLAAHPHLPRLIQRAGLDDNRYLRRAVTRHLRPLYTEGMRVLASAGLPWERAELPHLAAGLYHLIFAYFANATLLESIVDGDPRSPAAVARQRRFLKRAVAQLLGLRQ